MAKNPEMIAAIDLGTHRCRCVVAEIAGPERLELLGVGEKRTEGIRKGVIVNLEALIGSIKGAIGEAEQTSGRQIESLVATIPAAQARSFTSRGVVKVAGRDAIVSRKDLEKVLETVRAVQIPSGQTILHTLPQEYTLDGQEGIQDPVGMTGSRLEASVHVVTVPQQTAQHVVTALNRAPVGVSTLVFPLLAAAEAALTAEEKDQGVFLIDIGGGTTDVALFERGALWYTGSIPIAGDQVTNDISIGLRTPAPSAETIKQQFARATPLADEEATSIEIPSVGGAGPRLVPNSVLAQIVGPRVQEIFEKVRGGIDRFGLGGRARAGAVLVGGTAELEGILDVAEQKLGMAVRTGVPEGVDGLDDETRKPSFATPIGLALWELRCGRRERAESRERGGGLFGGMRRGARRVKNFFGQMF